MTEPTNGTRARMDAIDTRVTSVADEQREQRSLTRSLAERTAVNEREVVRMQDSIASMEERINKSFKTIHERLDKQTRAFWMAAGTMGSLTVAVVTAVGVLLGTG